MQSSLTSSGGIPTHPPFSCEMVIHSIGPKEAFVIHTLIVQIPRGKASQPQLDCLPADSPPKPYSLCCPSSVGIDSILPPSATMVCTGGKRCSVVLDRISRCLSMHHLYSKSFGLLCLAI